MKGTDKILITEIMVYLNNIASATDNLMKYLLILKNYDIYYNQTLLDKLTDIQNTISDMDKIIYTQLNKMEDQLW